MQSTNAPHIKRNELVKKGILRILVLCTGLSFVIIGLLDSGFKDVYAKAIRVCMECIGIG